jgi:hypothetical protein
MAVTMGVEILLEALMISLILHSTQLTHQLPEMEITNKKNPDYG